MLKRKAPTDVSSKGSETRLIEGPRAKYSGRGMSYMSVEFVDTNVIVYAHEGGAGSKHRKAVDLLTRLFEEQAGAVSVRVLSEFYITATRKLGMKSEEAEEAIADLGGWTIHRPGHGDVLRACKIHRRHKVSWWDALIYQQRLRARLRCAVERGTRGGAAIRNRDSSKPIHFVALTLRRYTEWRPS
jgi:predicted nucleic acid-binding protein